MGDRDGRDVHLRFSALRRGAIALHRITIANVDEVAAAWAAYPDPEYMLAELAQSYRPA